MFEAIFGAPLERDVLDELRAAQPARNAVMHGQTVSDAAMRGAVVAALRYSQLLNEQTSRIAGFRAYGPLRGFSGRGVPISDAATHSLLRRLAITRT